MGPRGSAGRKHGLFETYGPRTGAESAAGGKHCWGRGKEDGAV